MGNSQRVINYKLKTPDWPSKRTSAPGILVLDTCTLALLASPIPRQMFSDKVPESRRPRTFLGLLPLLPRDVIGEIHIPDFVAYEATRHSYVPEYDTHRETPYLKDREKIRYKKIGTWEHEDETDRTITNFLNAGVANGKPFAMPVKIAMCHQSEDYFRRLGMVKNIVGIQKSISSLMRDKESAYSASEKNIKIAERHVHEARQNYEMIKKQGDDLGEIISAQHAMNYVAAHAAPVAFLTEDHYAHQMLNKNMRRWPHRKEVELYNTNFYGLMQAMKEAGVLAEAGISTSVTAEQLTKAALDYDHKDHERKVDNYDIMDHGTFATRIMTARIHGDYKKFL